MAEIKAITLPSGDSYDIVDQGAVRYDKEQALTPEQKTQARSNIGAGTSSFSGNYSDLNGNPDINDGTLTMQVNGTQKATFKANQSGDSTFNITAADLGLTNSMVFVGTSTTDPKSPSGATVSGHDNWKKGEVVLYGKKEYVLTDDTNSAANWTELGDEGSFALKSVTITGAGALEGGGTLEANRTITHKTSGATAGSYGDSRNQTPAYGATFKVPYVTVNDTGHVTGISDHTVKIPASDNTNQTVKGNGTAFSANDAVDIVAGSNVTVTADTTNKKITIAATDTNTHNSHAIISGLKADGTTKIQGSASSGNITMGDSGVTAGEYGPTANQAPAYGATFNVPDIKVNAKGVVTSAVNRTVKIPASDNTDTKVTQSLSTTNGDYPVILKNNTTATDSPTSTTNYAAAVKVNPSTGNLTVTKINGVAVGTSPKFTDTTYESKTAASGGTAVSLVTTGEKYTWNNKGSYSKPSGGIPKTDLASAVQTSLGKADSALQSHQDISGKLDKSGGTMTGNLTVGSSSIQTNGYITGTWLQSTASNHLGATATKFTVQDSSGWVYYRTASEMLNDLGINTTYKKIVVSSSQPSGMSNRDFWYEVN